LGGEIYTLSGRTSVEAGFVGEFIKRGASLVDLTDKMGGTKFFRSNRGNFPRFFLKGGIKRGLLPRRGPSLKEIHINVFCCAAGSIKKGGASCLQPFLGGRNQFFFEGLGEDLSFYTPLLGSLSRGPEQLVVS